MFAKVWTPEDPRVTKLVTNNIDKQIETIELNKQNNTWTSTDVTSDTKNNNTNNFIEKFDDQTELSVKPWSSSSSSSVETMKHENMDIGKIWSNNNDKTALTKYDMEKHMSIDCVAVQS